MPIDATTDAAIPAAIPEREALPAAPQWRVEATYGQMLITAYTGPDFDVVRKRIGDMVLAADTREVMVYRNGAMYRKAEIERGQS